MCTTKWGTSNKLTRHWYKYGGYPFWMLWMFSRTSTTFKKEIKIKSTILKRINFDYLRGTMLDGGRVAGCDRHEVEPVDARTPSERRGRRPVASGSRCSCPPLAVELPLQPAQSPPSLALTAPLVGGPSAGRWKNPQREKRSTPRALRL
jgi:hypothetical protein